MKMGENSKYVLLMVVLLYPDIKFLIDFLDELGNFKQKNFYTSKCKILHFEMSG